MRLRHKKPINSYKGQANNDKNEFNDDDFRQQGSPHKKVRETQIQNGGAPTDQIFKYARILSKFVKTINQDYKAVQAPGSEVPLPTSPQLLLPPDKTPSSIPSRLDRPSDSREHKPTEKLQPKFQIKEPLPPKNPPRRKDNPPPPSPRPEPRSTAPFLQETQPKGASPAPRHKQENRGLTTPPPVQEKKDGTKMQNGSSAQQGPGGMGMGMGGMPGMQGIPGMQGMQGMPGMQGMAGMPGMTNQLMAQMAMMMQGAMGNMGGNMNQMELAQMLMRYNNQQGMFYQNFPPMNMMGMNMNNMFFPNQNNPNAPKPKPVPSLFEEQLAIYRNKPHSKEEKDWYPLKKSASQASIAYRIYLDNLKKTGVSIDNPKDIDPTKSSRRVKSDQQNRNRKKK